MNIKKLYLKYKEVVNYLIFGTLTTFLTLAVYYLLTISILNPENSIELQIANILSWIVGFLFAFFTNRKYVFESNSSSKFSEFMKFFLSRISTLLLDMAIMFIFVTLMHFNNQILKLISQVCIIVGNYLLSKFFVFKKDKVKLKNKEVNNMKEKYLFSVIVPIYNVEDYLEETIKSVIDQTIGFDKIQLILVNDGSLDNSEKICLKYKEQYPDNVLYIKKENGGVSSARNEGIKHIEGKYVSFLDSDDKWELDVFEKVYNFFEKNYNNTDVVALKMKFFGSKEGTNHPLNFKFKEDRVIDLNKEPNYVQMSMATTFVKASSLKDKEFNCKLKYAEDALLINTIIMNKMKLGVLKSPSYLYRKREEGNSAIDTCLSREAYYNVVLENFHDKLISLAKKKFGDIPLYIQYVLMYDLQWRIKSNIPDNVLSENEKRKYIEHIKKLLQVIDIDVINNQKNIWAEHKMYALSLKYGSNVFEKAIYSDGEFYYKDRMIYSLKKSSPITVKIINIREKSFQIAGVINFPLSEKKYTLYIDVNGKKEKLECVDSPFESKNCMDGELYSIKLFNYFIDLEKNKNISIKFYLKFNDKEVQLTPKFTQYGRLNNNLKLHYTKNKKTLYYKNKTIKYKKVSLLRRFRMEAGTLARLLKKGDYKSFAYRFVGRIYKVFKRKEIWFVSDRTLIANDNGMHLFKYITSLKDKKRKVYFVISKKSKDYNEMKKYGKVIAHNSLRYKLMYFKVDKIISSQADVWVVNPYGKKENCYRDMYAYDFVFLQHGVTKDDISSWLNLYNKNISLFVTTGVPEYQSILDGTYYYQKDNVILTGMPRYDNLYDENDKTIAIMPTWRRFLSGKMNAANGTRDYNPEFKDSEYFKFYNGLINDERILNKMKEKGYKGIFVVHPTHMNNYKDFKGNDVYKVVEGYADYQKIFREASLLLSDYSSVPFDFAYLFKPVIYAQFDKEEFFGNHIYSEGYFSYEKNGFGPVTYDYEQTVEKLLEMLDNDCKLDDEYRKRAEEFYGFHDRENCKRVYEKICEYK